MHGSSSAMLPAPDPRAGERNGPLLYGRLAGLYDVLYGAGLAPGRRLAVARLSPRPGERVLEVGIGTGLSATAYPRGCDVVGIDRARTMLAQARRRLRREASGTVRLCCMDAEALALPDAAFDAVYAPYVVNVVSNPVAALREFTRVCRRGGRIVLLNHFTWPDAEEHTVARALGWVARRAGGARWDLDLDALLRETGLTAVSVERTNVPRVSAVVVCRVP